MSHVSKSIDAKSVRVLSSGSLSIVLVDVVEVVSKDGLPLVVLPTKALNTHSQMNRL